MEAASAYRAVNAGRIGVAIAADYKLHDLRARWYGWEQGTPEHSAELSAVHQRSAEVGPAPPVVECHRRDPCVCLPVCARLPQRLVHICERYGGMYTKFGQVGGRCSPPPAFRPPVALV